MEWSLCSCRCLNRANKILCKFSNKYCSKMCWDEEQYSGAKTRDMRSGIGIFLHNFFQWEECHTLCLHTHLMLEGQLKSFCTFFSYQYTQHKCAYLAILKSKINDITLSTWIWTLTHYFKTYNYIYKKKKKSNYIINYLAHTLFHQFWYMQSLFQIKNSIRNQKLSNGISRCCIHNRNNYAWVL